MDTNGAALLQQLNNADASNAVHNYDDLDLAYNSHHHTIGKGPTQAAAGNHTHASSLSYGSVTPNTKLTDVSANGVSTTVARSDHVHGTPVSLIKRTTDLPITATTATDIGLSATLLANGLYRVELHLIVNSSAAVPVSFGIPAIATCSSFVGAVKFHPTVTSINTVGRKSTGTTQFTTTSTNSFTATTTAYTTIEALFDIQIGSSGDGALSFTLNPSSAATLTVYAGSSLLVTRLS